MNKYDDYYIFRIARMDDIDRIMLFIKTEWKANHIFAVDKEFFCYEHLNGDQFNFILAIDKETDEIAGLQGFIPYSSNEQDHRFAVSGVIIKAKVPSRLPALGVEIMKRVAQLVPYEDYCAVGVNPKTCLPLTKRYMNRYIGAMQHYYRVNSEVAEFQIATITNLVHNSIDTKALSKLHTVNQIEDSRYDFHKQYENLPYKDQSYVNRRYFSHPIYKYQIMEVVANDGDVEGLLIGREVRVNDSGVLRLVDYIGNTEAISTIGVAIDNLMRVNKYEYVDFVLEGIDEKVLNQAGFVQNTGDSGNQIPNYFEPFVPDNIVIWFEKSNQNMVLFKADGDQDRPNFR